jgi:putative endonuclease
MDTPTFSRKNQLGKWGEQQAEKYLLAKGCQVLKRNVRTPYGEIDLVAHEGDVLVFVEVKTRSSRTFGNPEEAVTDAKLTHIIESAESYLQENLDFLLDWRIDVIAITKIPGQDPEITHFENAVSA